ncbi:MAG TPA: DNA ligase D [Methylomirabilota bacterium]|nr:DNA ligase D [Methylomirabilota bacterium]
MGPELTAYRGKRDPERTPEPFGGRPTAAGRLFVVQKHAARRLHYDLRLEMDGVLKSWAVPKGPSAHPEERRLAVQVEDHPVEYGDFEGVIPPGNYGAGSVIVWDHGSYRSAKPEEPLAQLARGKLEVEIFGHKMRGRWTLARMSGKTKDWLLLKKADGAAVPAEAADLPERYPQSVISGLTVEEMADRAGRRGALRARLDALGAPRGEVVARRQPFTLATLAERPFSDPAWIYEIKYDGVRVLASRRGERVELYGRSGQDITSRYPEVARALRALPADSFVIDGEIVALDDAGRPSFQRLQSRMGLTDPREIERVVARRPVIGVFFDCLMLEDRDLRKLPLVDRKECLRLLVPPLGTVRYGDHVAEAGEAFFDLASEQRLEGIVAKRARSLYTGTRTRDWIKIKCQRRQEFVIGGYTDPQGSRGHFGALHLGLYDGPIAAPRLVYVSKVGTGFDRAGLRAIWEALRPLARATSPFDAGAVPTGRGHHWVEPRLVCEVRFTEWTEDGGLRHPTFVGLRDDKKPTDCRREEPEPMREGEAAGGPERLAAPERSRAPEPLPADRARRSTQRGQQKRAGVGGLGGGAATAPPQSEQDAPVAPAPARLRPTNVNKVFWPADGLTKGDLIAYYERVAPLMLPYLRDRPLVLTRFPDGIGGKSFYQKDAPEFAPAWVRTERIYSRDTERDIAYLVVDDMEMLRYVANSAAIPIHLWASRIPSLERPDWLVLDLDPKGAPFTDVVRVALALRRILDRLELPSYVKTSGATGLHILLPLGARYTYEQCRTFARLLAILGVEAEPDISTVARPLRARGGKVYIDFGQNGYGQTIVAPYSLRPLPGAPASCPLEWREVTPRLDPAQFTLRTLPARFDRRDDPLRPVLGEGIDLAAALERIEALRVPSRLGGAGRVKRTPRRVSASGAPAAAGRRRGRSRPPRA